jgi:hypothetical protein
MEVLRMPVPCVCAPNETGEHPIELHVQRFPGERDRPTLRLRSIRTPCDFGEADAIDRLGGVSCIGAINDIRAVMRGEAGTTPGVRDVLPVQIANALPRANSGNGFLDLVTIAEAARRVRSARASARVRVFGPDDAIARDWSPARMRLAHAEPLFAQRLRQHWPMARDIQVNLRLAQPQVQVSWGLLERQPIYEFKPMNTRRTRGGWRLKQATGKEGATHNDEHHLNRLLPVSVMRGVRLLWERQ